MSVAGLDVGIVEAEVSELMLWLRELSDCECCRLTPCPRVSWAPGCERAAAVEDCVGTVAGACSRREPEQVPFAIVLENCFTWRAPPMRPGGGGAFGGKLPIIDDSSGGSEVKRE